MEYFDLSSQFGTVAGSVIGSIAIGACFFPHIYLIFYLIRQIIRLIQRKKIEKKVNIKDNLFLINFFLLGLPIVSANLVKNGLSNKSEEVQSHMPTFLTIVFYTAIYLLFNYINNEKSNSIKSKQ